MNTRLARILTITAAAAMLASFVIATPASAQTAAPFLSATISVPQGLIKPEIDAPQFDVKFTYQLSNPNQVPITTVNAVAVVTVKWTCPATMSVTGPGSVSIPLSGMGPTDLQSEATVKYQVQITRNAPGLQTLTCKFDAKAGAVQSPSVPESNPVAQDVTFRADYFPLVQAKVANKVKQAGPQKQIGFDIELSNFGNAQTQVSFSLEGSAPKGWKPVPPDNLILDSPTSGGGKTADTVSLSIATPFKNGWNNDEQPFRLVMTPSATADPTKAGNVVTANVLARVRGVYIPTLEPMLMLGAVLGTGLLLRLKKE